MTDSSAPEPFYDRAFIPYATEIGFFLREYNDLQEMLCNLFCNSTSSTNGAISAAIWYLICNDRQQRGMLRAAAPHAFPPYRDEFGKLKKPMILEEIEWLLDRVDALGTSMRDPTAHSPLCMLLGEDEFTPHHFEGKINNPIAETFKRTLKNKKLLAELKKARRLASTYRHYANRLTYWIYCSQIGEPLPSLDRPLLQDPPAKTKGRNPNQKAPSK